jgi:hypothetical protein
MHAMIPENVRNTLQPHGSDKQGKVQINANNKQMTEQLRGDLTRIHKNIQEVS